MHLCSKLCRKLPLNAETQQIDRILETFAIRYWECNLNSIFGNADVVYAIVYSILLLNTDLHVAQGEHKKMSRSAFIRNTMCAIRAQVNMFNDTATRSNPMAQFVGTKMWYSDIESILKVSIRDSRIRQDLGEAHNLSLGNVHSCQKCTDITTICYPF